MPFSMLSQVTNGLLNPIVSGSGLWILDTIRNLIDGNFLVNASVSVDHNFGGTDNLRVTDAVSGAGIGGVFLKAYFKVDWDNNNRSKEFLKGQSITKGDGRWLWPMLLDPGIYYIVLEREGFEQVILKEITIM